MLPPTIRETPDLFTIAPIGIASAPPDFAEILVVFPSSPTWTAAYLAPN